jgi:hypothetical protein
MPIVNLRFLLRNCFPLTVDCGNSYLPVSWKRSSKQSCVFTELDRVVILPCFDFSSVVFIILVCTVDNGIRSL